ncbi:drug/metabolite transporter (DMT)-like permease [Pararhizobium capsulatum DSM 1112]|uniref:Drug/metabolite transporter (DMT)-like permease n=1 Tax=Pararhizobium capsulatum DSM 1112 TaxID=1121113 RepID=A0ABU0BVD6_9HYPH|nr:DMT family transporter [Pararhizobium capsulatum]MDQ0321947.1 drug/metabolite transporter (DMT)-like permease [Pararhizobium capsulatum DSM 1112]
MSSKKTGYIFVLLAITIFSIQDAISKYLGSIYPPVLITMIRYWAFASFALAWAARSPGGLPVAFRTRRPILQILRGVLLAVQIVIVITSFAQVGLAHSQAIFSSGPIFVALLSMPILGERVGWRRWTAIIVGLLGVLLILKPDGTNFDLKVLIPISSALIFAFYVIATRLVSHDDSSTTSFLYTGVAGAAVISLVGPFYWTPLAPGDWVWMILLCITGTTSHFSLIKAYEHLDAAEVQPLTYLQLVYASIIGVSVFGETLNLNVIAGSTIVVAAGIFTIWREAVVARRNAKVAARGPTQPLS